MYYTPKTISAWIGHFRGCFGPKNWILNMKFAHWAVKDSVQISCSSVNIYGSYDQLSH